MQQLIRDNGLFVEERLPGLDKDICTIERIVGNQYLTKLSIAGTGGHLTDAHTGFSIPSKDISYFLGQMGFQSTKQLVGASVYLYHTGVGGMVYGISPVIK